MRRAVRVMRKGLFVQAGDEDSIMLDFDGRYRRRTMLFTENRRAVLLDLDRVMHMRDGDALVLTDGSLVLIAAKQEPLLEITAHDPGRLIRIAWHLGNRHLPVQFEHAALRIRADDVIARMVEGLGGEVRALSAPFDPEGGAYDHGGDTEAEHDSMMDEFA
jgi:urease accessory protein